jgi:peptidoglycan/xylan/chitin deacetylase (PgdA/CDA1 family)
VSPDLYRENAPERFWRLMAEREPTHDEWALAIRRAASVLPPEARSLGEQIDSILAQTLGEGQFGPDHWRLGHAREIYYALKPVLPRSLTRRLKSWYGAHREGARQLGWPIEARYVRFQFDVMRHLVSILRRPNLPFIDFWPHGRQYAFVLTHDIETSAGQAFAHKVADLDSAFGFRSAFNFVPERYRVDRGLMQDLRARGFEIGVHGLKHDGRDFSSHVEFLRRASLTNRHLRDFEAVGFRAPLTHRNPEWMQALDIEYDSSFFDTDPYEPIAGGTMTIWPFQLGRFVEMPYTLTQDYTASVVLGETSPRLWVEKTEFIRANHGMALLNTHPDYLRHPRTWSMYSAFLETMSGRGDYYHALPRDVARWWRARAQAVEIQNLPDGTVAIFGADGEIRRSESAIPGDRYAARTEDVRSSAARTA